MKLMILSVTFALSSWAWAGVGAHGGNVVTCAGKPSVTLDYYDATLPTVSGPVKTVDISSMSEQQVIDFVRSRMNGTPFQSKFDGNLFDIGPIESWVAADLKSIDDSAEPYSLPANCVRETAAARQGSRMYGDTRVLAKLSPAQRGLLRSHEALYRLSGQETSAPIRDLFRVMLAENFDVYQMYFAVRALGSFYAMWDYVWTTSGWYVAKDSEVKISASISYQAETHQFLYPTFEFFNADALRPSAYLRLECKLETQSCMVNDVVVNAKVPNLKNCEINMPTPNRLTFKCPAFGGKTLIFAPRG